MMPQLLHFIWIGNKLPLQYYYHIRTFSTLAHNAKTQVIFWGDKTSLRSIYQHEIDNRLPPNVTLKNIDDFFESQPELPEIIKNLLIYAQKERIGPVNFAAATDIYRIIILYLLGGMYCDPDNKPQTAPISSRCLSDFENSLKDLKQNLEDFKQKKLSIPCLPHGFAILGVNTSHFKFTLPEYYVFNNCIMISEKNHPLLLTIMKKIVSTLQFSETEVDLDVVSMPLKWARYAGTTYQYKRTIRNYAAYIEGVINTTGARLIWNCIKDHIREKKLTAEITSENFPQELNPKELLMAFSLDQLVKNYLIFQFFIHLTKCPTKKFTYLPLIEARSDANWVKRRPKYHFFEEPINFNYSSESKLLLKDKEKNIDIDAGCSSSFRIEI